MDLNTSSAAPVLLTGITGFVGSHLASALGSAGYTLRGFTRNVAKARVRWPAIELCPGDVENQASLERALAGCGAAIYLVHGMAEGAADYRRREGAAAERFARAAAGAGVKRIIYLGGVAPASTPSEHLRSRLEVGEILRAGTVPTVELRASMIVGHGSLSWLIVRDLAARLPYMVLPQWLKSRTQPVAIDDVLVALVKALSLPLSPAESAWFDIPGPEILSGRQILEKTAAVMGRSQPHILEVPFLTPRLSSHWIRLVTRADWSVAREVVLGLAEDLLAKDDHYWHAIGHPQLMEYKDAALRALAAERRKMPAGAWGIVERLLSRRGSVGTRA